MAAAETKECGEESKLTAPLEETRKEEAPVRPLPENSYTPTTRKRAATVWREIRTPEGKVYFFNTASKETSWDRPKELEDDDDRDESAEWFWVEDGEDAFVPAKLVKKFFDGRVELEVEKDLPDGTLERTKKMWKGVDSLIPLSLSALRTSSTAMDDLVHLDTVNEPLILYLLKKRCKSTTWK